MYSFIMYGCVCIGCFRRYGHNLLELCGGRYLEHKMSHCLKTESDEDKHSLYYIQSKVQGFFTDQKFSKKSCKCCFL
jgi:hypothetical protein